jgi:DNA polymerase-4
MSNDRPLHRRILLVDCDAFYVQVARLEDPEGAGRRELLIVGGSSDGRGVVTSASYACRAFGVRSAMPTAQALRLCPDATVVPVPRSACSARSREVHAVLRDLAPLVQAASIDEFYLDLTGMERLLRGESLPDAARRIQRDVYERTSIRVSIGGGTNRLIAKLASTPAKPNGVHVVEPGGEADFVAALELRQLPGVGPALQRQLADRGLRTVLEARAVDPVWLERWFGDTRARWLQRLLFGRDDSPILAREPRQSVSSERTFSRDLDDDRELERVLLRLTTSVAATLRDEGHAARTVTVKLRDQDFTTRQRSHTLQEAVTSNRVIFDTARTLLADLRQRRARPARLLGIALSGLGPPGEGQQLALFEAPADAETERDRTLSRVLDDVRSRFGSEALLPGSIAPDGPSASRDPDGGAERIPPAAEPLLPDTPDPNTR